VSARPGPAGRAVTAVRRGVLRLLAPTLGELLAQLERDRHRHRAELTELRARVARLEAEGSPAGVHAAQGRGEGGGAPAA